LRFIELFDLRFQLVASTHEISQLIGSENHCVLDFGADVVELLPPILLRMGEPDLEDAGIPITRSKETGERSKRKEDPNDP
jgi:hypothetical protein